MTLRSLVSPHSRPLRTALVCSAAAIAWSLGSSAATADDDHRRGHDRRGGYDRGRDHRDDDDRDYRGRDRDRSHGRYSSGRSHRDPGYYRGDRYRDDYRYRNSYRGGYDRGYYNRGYSRGYSSGRFAVPHHIYRDRYHDYDRYYRGAVFYGPHRHQHRVYLFPVIIGGYTEYRPYAYCGDAYYPDHYSDNGYDGYGYDGGRGHLGLHFNF